MLIYQIVLAELPSVSFSNTTIDETVQALAINSQSLHVLNVSTPRALIRIEIDGDPSLNITVMESGPIS